MVVVGLPLDIRTLILHRDCFTLWRTFITGTGSIFTLENGPAAQSWVTHGSPYTSIRFKSVAERNSSLPNYIVLQFDSNGIKSFCLIRNDSVSFIRHGYNA